MDITRLLNLPCTIHTVTDGAVDEYGDPTVTTTDTDTVCWYERRNNSTEGNERSGAENWLIDTLDLYLPAGTAIGGDDRVTIGDDLYEVLGPPHQYTHPRHVTGVYVSAIIRRVS